MVSTDRTATVIRPCPSMASRAFTAMLTSAVSNWLGSAFTWHGAFGRRIST